MRQPKLSNILCALTVGLMCLLVAGREVCAQDGGIEEKQKEQAIEGAAKAGRTRGNIFQGLPERSDESRANPVPLPPKANNVPKFAPAAGTKQLMGEEMAKFYSGLRDSPVSQLMQTYCMVENGGCQGFFGAINTTHGMMNTVGVTTQMQHIAFDSLNSADANKQGWVNNVYNSQSGDNKDIWPAAVIQSSGDPLNEGEVKEFNKYARSDSPTGSSSEDIEKGTNEAAPSNSFLLSKSIFEQREGETGELIDGIPLGEWEARFKNLVGDYESKSQPDGTTDSTKENFIPPPVPTFSTDPLAAYKGECSGKAGYDAYLCVTIKNTWRPLNYVMAEYCKFKQENPNKDKGIFEKVRPADAIKQEHWDAVQSVDNVGLSVNLLDQFFKLAMTRKRIEDVDCNKLFNINGSKIKDPPKEAEYADDSFDDCGENDTGDVAKACLRNVILLRMAGYIAEQKTNVFYRTLAQATLMRAAARSPNHFNLATQVFCQMPQLSIPCNPIEEFNIRIAENRVEWGDFLTYFSKLAQGAGNGAVFKPLSNNISSYAQGGTGR